MKILFRSLGTLLYSLVRREYFNLVQILLGAILLYQQLLSALVLLVSLQLLQLLGNEGKLLKREKLLKRDQLKRDQREEVRKKLKLKLKDVDSVTLRKLVGLERARELLEEEGWDGEKLNILEEVLKESTK